MGTFVCGRGAYSRAKDEIPRVPGAFLAPLFAPQLCRRLRLFATKTREKGGPDYCCLYTDLSNPTSNWIYRRIGYTPILDVSEMRFVAR